MREPIKPEDIREGDLIRREPLDSRSLRAVEYVAPKDGYTHGLSGSDTDVFYLLDRPTPAVHLPSEETLGRLTWQNSSGSRVTVLATWALRSKVLVSDLGHSIWSDKAVGFDAMVAVPKAALDRLRAEHADDQPGACIEVIDFLAAVDVANKEGRR